MNSKAILATAVACLCVSSVQSVSADDLTYEWYTVANNGDLMPTDSSGDCGSCHDGMAGSGEPAAEGTKRFNSYNQPAISKQGVVVFRARSRGGEGGGPGQGEPERGIYMRNLAEQGPLFVGVPAPRHGAAAEQHHDRERTISSHRSTSSRRCRASTPDPTRSRRAGSRRRCGPIMLPDGTETRTGTAGVYTSSGHGTPTTGASMLGDVYEGGVQTFPYFQVPVHGAVPAGYWLRPVPGLACGHGAQHDRVQGQFRGGWRRQDGRLLPRHRRQGAATIA